MQASVLVCVRILGVGSAASDKLLTALDSDRTTLRELAEHALDNPQLRHLHVFLPGYSDRPHNHRWT